MRRHLHLESLRGLAAISVVFYHAPTDSFFTSGFMQHSWIMVDFFFVLSGYVISLAYFESIKDKHDLFSFQWERFVRLYPLHLSIIILFFLYEILRLWAENDGIFMRTPAFSSEYSVEYLIYNIFMLHIIFTDVPSWNYPSWSISAEFVVYLLFGIFCLVYCRYKRLAVILSGLAILIALIQLLSTGSGLATTSDGIWRCIYGFFIGVFLQRFETAKPASGSVSFLAPIMLLLLIASITTEALKGNLQLIYPPLFAVAILLLNKSSPRSLIRSLLEDRALVYLGTISYGVYMIHALVWRIFEVVIGRVVPSIIDSTPHVALPMDLIMAASHLCVVLVVIASAHLSYIWLEKPIRATYGKRFSRTRR